MMMKKAFTFVALLALFYTLNGCKQDISLGFKSAGEGADNMQTESFKMLKHQYTELGSGKLFYIDKFRELSRYKVEDGYVYHVKYQLVFITDPESLLKKLNEGSKDGFRHENDVKYLVKQYGRFKPGTRLNVEEQVAILETRKGRVMQRR